MRTRKALKKAFTLVEILIVVVILGILAAIVIPQFGAASRDSQASNIAAQLGTLQRQIELFQARTGAYPTFATDAATGNWAELINGDYIKSPPRNPAGTTALTDVERITVITSASAGVDGSDAAGWVFNTAADGQDTVQNTLYASYFEEESGTMDTANASSADL